MTAHSEALRIGAASSWRIVAKRVVDVLASAVGLALLMPLFALIAVAIWREDGGPVFYRQTRVGRAGRPFEINKFRSMTLAPRGSGSHLTLAGDPRVTRTGAFLRRAKLDELPQLLNVLIGDMSLVGPRPESPELIIHYGPSERAVMLSVRPGMTDYASVLLRNESDLLAQARDPVRILPRASHAAEIRIVRALYQRDRLVDGCSHSSGDHLERRDAVCAESSDRSRDRWPL